MAYIATLKKNNTVIYPQTKSTAVYEDDGVTALDTVVVKKSTAAGDADKMIKADGTKALVGASNIDFTTLPGNYSTSEINTGYTWVDGSAIYKKTINTGALPANTDKNVAHNISNISRVIKMEGYAYSASDDNFIPLPYTHNGGASYQVRILADKTTVLLSDSYDFSTKFAESYVTLWYTKTS